MIVINALKFILLGMFLILVSAAVLIIISLPMGNGLNPKEDDEAQIAYIREYMEREKRIRDTKAYIKKHRKHKRKGE